MFDLDAHILRWRRSLATWGIGKDKLDELEEHLRDSIEIRIGQGMNDKEAFISARNTLGNPDQLKREYQKELIARITDSVGKTALSFEFLRAGALLTLATVILAIVVLQNGPFGRYQGLLHSLVQPTGWVTSVFAALAVWASLNNLNDAIHKRALRVFLAAIVLGGVLLYASPNSIAWSGATWILIFLILSYFLSGRRLVLGAVISWLGLSAVGIAWVLQRPDLTTSPFEIAEIFRLVFDTLPAAILIYGLSRAPKVTRHKHEQMAQV